MYLENGVWQSKNQEALGCKFHFAYKTSGTGGFDLVLESPEGEVRISYPASDIWVEAETDWPESLFGKPVAYGFDHTFSFTEIHLDDIRFISPTPPPEQFALYGNVGEAGKSVTIKKDNAGEWKIVGTVVSLPGGGYRVPESGFYAISLPEVKEDNYQLIINDQVWNTKFIPEGEWVEEV